MHQMERTLFTTVRQEPERAIQLTQQLMKIKLFERYSMLIHSIATLLVALNQQQMEQM
jgi:hypothetical protein